MTVNTDTTQWNLFEEKWRLEHPSPRDFAFIKSHRRKARTAGTPRSMRWPLTIVAFLLSAVSETAGLMLLADSGVDVVRNGAALTLLVVTGAAMTLAVVAVNTYRWQ